MESTIEEKRKSCSQMDAETLQVLIKFEKLGKEEENYPSVEKVRERVNYEIFKTKNR